MCFTPDSFSAMIMWEFSALFACRCSVWNLLKGVKDIYRRVSRVIIFFIAVQPPTSLSLPKPNSVVFIVQIGKKPTASVHIFSRPE